MANVKNSVGVKPALFKEHLERSTTQDVLAFAMLDSNAPGRELAIEEMKRRARMDDDLETFRYEDRFCVQCNNVSTHLYREHVDAAASLVCLRCRYVAYLQR